jgi:hypothetical protein
MPTGHTNGGGAHLPDPPLPTLPIPPAFPVPVGTPGLASQSPDELQATIAYLQEQLRVSGVTSTAGAPTPGATGGVPPAITVTLPVTAPAGAVPLPAGGPSTVVPPGTGGGPAATAAQPAAGTGILRGPSSTPTTTLVSFGSGLAVGSAAPGTPAPGGSDRWYAVVVGREPRDTGVYKDFANVEPLVTGVSGGVFRGPFKTKTEAESFLSSMVSLPVATTPSRRQKWYVVSVGQDPTDRGVYGSWPEVAAKVVGVSGAVYQGGFKSQAEAEAFLARSPMPGPAPAPRPVPGTTARSHQPSAQPAQATGPSLQAPQYPSTGGGYLPGHPRAPPPSTKEGAPKQEGIRSSRPQGPPPTREPCYTGSFPSTRGGGLLRESPRWVTVAMGTQPPLLGPMEPPLHTGTGPTPPASPYGGPGHQGGGHPAGPYGHPTPPFNGQMPGSAGPPNPYMEGSMVGTVQPPPEAIQMLGLREPPVPWQSLDGTAATRRS